MDVQFTDPGNHSGQSSYFFFNDRFLSLRKNTFVCTGNNGIRLPCRIENKELNSLSYSSFGGIDTDRKVTAGQLTAFLRSMEKHPVVQGIKRIRIRSFPECYDPAFWRIQDEALASCGYSRAVTDTNMHIRLDKESFREGMHRSEYRCLNLARKEKWRFAQLDPAEYLTPAYNLYLEAKAIKGYPMSMTLQDLEAMYRVFPNDFLLFGVFRNEQLIAASTCIRINKRILYDFFHGDAVRYRMHSPVVCLIGGLFAYGQNQGMELLDQGICSHNGIPNSGLCTFKSKLGGRESRKIIYVKTIGT